MLTAYQRHGPAEIANDHGLITATSNAHIIIIYFLLNTVEQRIMADLLAPPAPLPSTASTSGQPLTRLHGYLLLLKDSLKKAYIYMQIIKKFTCNRDEYKGISQ